MSREEKPYITLTGKTLGTLEFHPRAFPESIYKNIESSAFRKFNTFEKHQVIGRLLCDQILQATGEAFLLPEVVGFITRVREVLSTYTLQSFEHWLEYHAEDISNEQKRFIRASIVGKDIPRSEYQAMFPIGNDTYYFGSHCSCAHFSPDIDTTVAAFACFLAAFGARVGLARHHLFIPSGPPNNSVEVERLFYRALGRGVFSALASVDSRLPITSLDLLSGDCIVRKKMNELSYDVDMGRGRQAVVLVDEEGHHLGDWRAVDVESVRGITTRFLNLLTDYQATFSAGLVEVLVKKECSSSDIKNFIEKSLSAPLNSGISAKEYTEKHRLKLDQFIQKIVGISSGLGATMDEFFTAGAKFGFGKFKEEVLTFNPEEKSGKVITTFTDAIQKFHHHIHSFEVAFKIKKEVLGREPTYLSHLANVDEIREKMGDYAHLAVNYHEADRQFLLGVIYKEDLNRKALCSSAWLDFSNKAETDARADVETLTIVDHHKTEFKSSGQTQVILKDVQSSNTIMANLCFEMNDKYSLGGMAKEQIEEEIQKLSLNCKDASEMRILQRLFKRKQAAMSRKTHYVSKEREILEYMQFIYAILDDTDLLTKYTEADVDCMCQLINRVKSLSLGKEVEVINFDDLDRTHPKFTSMAARKLIKNHELYSLYNALYDEKERGIDRLIKETVSEEDVTTFFQDTKTMGAGGYAVVTQFKHFKANQPYFHKSADSLRDLWIDKCKGNNESSLFIFMASTVASAGELYAELDEPVTYRDELWFYLHENAASKEIHQLERFLSVFQASSKMAKQEIEVHYYGKSEPYEKAFKQAIKRPLKEKHIRSSMNMAILLVDQGSCKSRKADIATHL